MKRVLFLVVLLVLIPCQVSAMTWEEFVEEYGEMPPPPPDATNTDVWVFDTPTFGDYSDGGDTPAELDAEKFLASVSIGPDDPWYWT